MERPSARRDGPRHRDPPMREAGGPTCRPHPSPTECVGSRPCTNQSLDGEPRAGRSAGGCADTDRGAGTPSRLPAIRQGRHLLHVRRPSEHHPCDPRARFPRPSRRAVARGGRRHQRTHAAPCRPERNASLTRAAPAAPASSASRQTMTAGRVPHRLRREGSRAVPWRRSRPGSPNRALAAEHERSGASELAPRCRGRPVPGAPVHAASAWYGSRIRAPAEAHVLRRGRTPTAREPQGDKRRAGDW
jgi:hypothetical protein